MFLLAVTGSGSAVGAAAAIPGVGTIASIAAVGAESAFFLEAAALLTLAVASVHGISAADHQQRRALVLSVALGESGMEIVQKATGVTAKNWASAITSRIPGPTMKGMNSRLVRKFITKYAARRSALVLGKLVPAGIGAAIGGAGNRAIGKGVVKNAREAFGPARPAGRTNSARSKRDLVGEVLFRRTPATLLAEFGAHFLDRVGEEGPRSALKPSRTTILRTATSSASAGIV